MKIEKKRKKQKLNQYFNTWMQVQIQRMMWNEQTSWKRFSMCLNERETILSVDAIVEPQHFTNGYNHFATNHLVRQSRLNFDGWEPTHSYVSCIINICSIRITYTTIPRKEAQKFSSELFSRHFWIDCIIDWNVLPFLLWNEKKITELFCTSYEFTVAFQMHIIGLEHVNETVAFSQNLEYFHNNCCTTDLSANRR